MRIKDTEQDLVPKSLFPTSPNANARHPVWSLPDSRALRSYDRYCAWSLSHLLYRSSIPLYIVLSAIVATRIVSVVGNYLGLTRAAPPPPTLTPEANSSGQGSGGVTTYMAGGGGWLPSAPVTAGGLALMCPSSPPPPPRLTTKLGARATHQRILHCFYVTSPSVLASEGTYSARPLFWITPHHRLILRLYIITSLIQYPLAFRSSF